MHKSFSPTDLQIKRFGAVLLGIFQVCIVGFWDFPSNLQATIWFALSLSFLWILIRNKKEKTFFRIMYFTGLCIAFFFFVTTNQLVVLFSRISIYFIHFLFLLYYYFDEKALASGTSFIAKCIAVVGLAIHTFFSQKTLALFVEPFISKGREFKIKREWFIGIMIAIPILLFFHALFSEVNSEYAVFIGKMFDAIEWVIRHIREYIWKASQIGLYSYLLFSFVSIPEDNLQIYEGEKRNEIINLNHISIVFTTVVILFIVFSFFQSKLLFINYQQLPFKELSLYTQKGFWELLCIAVFGYMLILYVLGKLEQKTSPIKYFFYLLLCFHIELFLITVFTQHKLFILQYYFGFKDQRILAGVAILLITMTFVLSIARLYKKIPGFHLFKIQSLAFVIAIVVVNMVNLDLLTTYINPISYYVNGKKYIDFSYLLGNSYDNHAGWKYLMKKGLEPYYTCIPLPKNYYWGSYRSIREDFYSRNNRTVNRSYLRDTYQKLKSKYYLLSRSKSLKELSLFNIHEYQTLVFLRENNQLVETFLRHAETSCKSEKNDDSYVSTLR